MKIEYLIYRLIQNLQLIDIFLRKKLRKLVKLKNHAG